MNKYKEKVRKLTRRQQGKSLEEVIVRLNKSIRGFANYFKIGDVKTVFDRLDKWIRMRLRAFIRRRRSTLSNQLIPNKRLEQAGLVSLVELLT
ncbi:group II intron maturase-specific domain-containing protein [Pseudalkalibacillus decolorationis]|uniref:group II intron maturase-specific domain-containing protein n=1 Tax=Pseudalkalibacillus decolorationis TaxID=163879 RepID=UPI0035586A32